MRIPDVIDESLTSKKSGDSSYKRLYIKDNYEPPREILAVVLSTPP
jgi:hypothetical protein